jgi:hypothetical protein
MEHAMRRHTLSLAIAAALAAPACALPTHAVRIANGSYAPYQGPVEVSMTAAPAGGQPIAIVEVNGTEGTVDKLMPAFLKRVATEGGNFAKIDDIAVVFEDQRSEESETYDCGTKEKPASCERTVTSTAVVGTLHIMGRAFRVEGRTP